MMSKLFTQDMEPIPFNQRSQYIGCLTLYFGKEKLGACFDEMLTSGYIGEKKHKAFMRQFFLEDKPMSATALRIPEPKVSYSAPGQIKKKNPRIPTTIRRVPAKRRTFMQRMKYKLRKLLK